jgi:DNA-binding MarR family transcriptional regulator
LHKQIENGNYLTEVIELLRELLHRLLVSSSASWVKLDMTLPQLRTLFIIAHRGKSSLKEMAENLNVGKSTASHHVDRLVVNKLVDRKQNPISRREVILTLTNRGQTLIEKLLGWEKIFGLSLDRISQDELTALRDGLYKVVSLLSEAENGEKVKKTIVSKKEYKC